MPADKMAAYIVTPRRTPDSAPEGYYVIAINPDQAKVRALRLAEAKTAGFIDVLAADGDP
jgi:hypothetical protein